MKVKLPAYNGKDNLVMAIVTPVFAFTFNYYNFPRQYFASTFNFLVLSISTLFAFGAYFIFCGAIAVQVKKRFPNERQISMRLSLSITCFLLLTFLFLYLYLNKLEDWFSFLNYHFVETDLAWNYVSLALLNIFITFLMEGIVQYNEWKKSKEENEKLSIAYKKSQLNGLKSQVNPHFLFNSLNSLSSLIQEDENEAETFLNEMTKVYRYMLRNDEDPMVTLETELKFIRSYTHILKARYGDSLQLKIDIADHSKANLIAPLTLQVLIENAFSQNIMSKANPLKIAIRSDDTDNLLFRNTVNPKSITEAIDFESGLDHLVKKYQLLGKNVLVNEQNITCRSITIPLILKEKEVPDEL
ncbi:sensor histidine kinase [Emticicia sp. BO119]|uniref:sensor histidine kinase n=1 Tax=Emticicia sp. BO119 TaxID=2757768 RepID=UPI0015F00333|nr:sensor histidine kinase [Emticicia sp. BO119]MBA4850370.1 histidine kinase [Emticicia sp. BO119]